MAEEKKSLQEWMAEERARLNKGFKFEPRPVERPSGAGSPADQIAAGLGLGAGVVGGAVAPHPNPVTFEGCRAEVIAAALRSEIPGDDRRVEVTRTGNSTVVTVLQSQANRPYDFIPALSVTLLEAGETLTVTVSDLHQDVKRGALGSVGGTVLQQGKKLLFRRRGVGGLIETAGDVLQGVESLVEDIQDLAMPKQVWEVIDRVGGAAQQAYLDKKRLEDEQRRQREAAERAWAQCEFCGRPYSEGEGALTLCPACGGARAIKPAWLP